jgi:hypothetical protein
MFLKLHEIEDPEKKAFILETLRLEFKDVVIEARKVLKHFNKLGSPIKVIDTNDEGTEIPIPCKMIPRALRRKLVAKYFLITKFRIV